MRTGNLTRLAAGLTLTLTLGTTACRRFRFPEVPANYREYAYVTSGDAGTVSVLDLVNMRRDKVLRVGINPSGIAANPKRNEVYAVNTGLPGSNGSLSVIDATRNEIAGTIPLHLKPYSISVDPSGRWGYVANSGANTVSVIDLEQRRETRTVGTGEAPGVAKISPDGRTLVVSNRQSGSVSVYAVGKDGIPSLRSTFDHCSEATDIAMVPLDASQPTAKAFVACSGADGVLAISLAQPPSSWNARQDSTLTGDHVLTRLRVGKTPVQLTVKPDGGEIFVSNFGSDSISEVSTWTNEVGGTYRIGMQPTHGIVSADNSTLWVANFGADSISLYSIDDGRLTGSVRTGSGPDSIAMSADEHLLIAANSRSGDVAVIRTHDKNGPELFTMLPAGPRPNGVAILSFETKAR